jgi:hypothetical protein
MVQLGAAPQLQDLYTLKEASKISVPTTEQQTTVQTLKAFMVLLYTMVGSTHDLLYLVVKQDQIDQCNAFQPLVEIYVASLQGQPVYT